MKAMLVLFLGLLVGCGDDRSSSVAQAPTLSNSYLTSNSIRYWWNGPTTTYPEALSVAPSIDAVYAEWVTEGTQRTEPMMVHYAHVQLVLGTQIELFPAQWLSGATTFEVSTGKIQVAMDGIWTNPATGTVYEGLEILKHCWDVLCGFAP